MWMVFPEPEEQQGQPVDSELGVVGVFLREEAAVPSLGFACVAERTELMRFLKRNEPKHEGRWLAVTARAQNQLRRGSWDFRERMFELFHFVWGQFPVFQQHP